MSTAKSQMFSFMKLHFSFLYEMPPDTSGKKQENCLLTNRGFYGKMTTVYSLKTMTEIRSLWKLQRAGGWCEPVRKIGMV